MDKIDHLLDDIRRSCELGEVENVILLANELSTHTNESPYKWLLNKFSIPEGSTYTEPKITLRQCASFINEFQKKHK